MIEKQIKRNVIKKNEKMLKKKEKLKKIID
jgi:hypothetical protein